jgi:hypothetical protein
LAALLATPAVLGAIARRRSQPAFRYRNKAEKERQLGSASRPQPDPSRPDTGRTARPQRDRSRAGPYRGLHRDRSRTGTSEGGHSAWPQRDRLRAGPYRGLQRDRSRSGKSEGSGRLEATSEGRES